MSFAILAETLLRAHSGSGRRRPESPQQFPPRSSVRPVDGSFPSHAAAHVPPVNVSLSPLQDGNILHRRKPAMEPPAWSTLWDLLKKSVAVNPKEMCVVESREETLPNGKIVQKVKRYRRYSAYDFGR